MAGEDINLVLRVRAQLGDAIRQLDRLEKEARGMDRLEWDPHPIFMEGSGIWCVSGWLRPLGPP